MPHVAIDQVMQRAEGAKSESDFTYFFSLLLAGEALAKTTVPGFVAAIQDDRDRNRYRIEHGLAKADGLGEWSKALEDVLTGPASQYLILDARTEQAELTKLCRAGEWQYESVASLKAVLNQLNIISEELPAKTDMKRWLRLFTTLRNGTRAHGALLPAKASAVAQDFSRSLSLFASNHALFSRPWAYLYRNLSGKYRVSAITDNVASFDFLKKTNDRTYQNGVYIFMGSPCLVPLIESDPELKDFFFANGGMTGKRFEMLSYCTDNRTYQDGSAYQAPPGTLPPSETEGKGELLARGKTFSNVPELIPDYVSRPDLERDLLKLLMDDKHPIVTLVGRGGIGKTSLALKVIERLCAEIRYTAIVWFSARDVDLRLTGPKPVRPFVVSPDDISRLYATLVLPSAKATQKGFNARAFFEQEMQKSDIGPCLYVFDNFETTQNPIEMFHWIDTFIKTPNKVLITTRLRDFKGDYPLEVPGMTEQESRVLIDQTASHLGIGGRLSQTYVDELISESAGHPYVIKILLGEVAKAGHIGNIPRMVAGSEELLTTLFERTYASLTPCAQRAFLTLCAWNSSVPRVALEAVLLRSTNERLEVEKGVESILLSSMAEIRVAQADKQEFISLPLVAAVFGKKKLNVSPFKTAIQSDVEILQMLGPARRSDIHLGLARRVENFIENISRRIEKGESFDNYSSILEMICRAYHPAWLILARWHIEIGQPAGLEKAKECLNRFLEVDPTSAGAADAWLLLAQVCNKTDDAIGEIHAFIERAQISSVPFYDLSNAANRLNQLLRETLFGIDREQKRHLAQRIAVALDKRRKEADADDYSRMAWLAIHLDQDGAARDYVASGLAIDRDNYHCQRLAERLGMLI